MPPTYTSNNRIKKIVNGDETGTWGTSTNTNFDLYDTAIDGVVDITLSGTSSTLTISDGAAASPDGRNKVLVLGGSPSGTHTITVSPDSVEKHYYIQNNTSQSVIIDQGSGTSGTTVTIAAGYSTIVYCDGAGSGASVKEIITKFKATEFNASTYTAAASLAVKPGSNSTNAIAFQTFGGTQVAALDTTNSRFCVGTVAPTAKLTISENASSVTPPSGTLFHAVGANAAGGVRFSIDGIQNGPIYTGRICFGTAASPSAVLSSSYLAALAGRGYLTTGYSGDLGQVAFQAEESFTDSTAATGIVFVTTAPGSVTNNQVARINGRGQFVIGVQAAGGLVNVPTNNSVGIELQSTTRAVLLSRMTTAQRDAMTAVDGMIIYNTTTGTIQGYQSGAWGNL